MLRATPLTCLFIIFTGSEEIITEDDLVVDNDVERDILPVAGAESVKMSVQASFPELVRNTISPIPKQSHEQLMDHSDSDEVKNMIKYVKIPGMLIKKVTPSMTP